MITVLGAGLTGLSAAYTLKSDYVILERENFIGGLCRSVETKGYTFDCAPHIFFTRNDYVNDLVSYLLGDNIQKQTRRAYIFLNGQYVEYPFEVNLYGLPCSIIEECIRGARNRPKTTSTNFFEWIYSTFGEGVAKYYMVPYNEKIWKYDLSQMSTEWIVGRVPAPSLEEMIKGMQSKVQKEYGPNAQFSYPIKGGIGALPNALSKKLSNVKLESEAIKLRPIEYGVESTYTSRGKVRKIISRKVISSIPLPEVVKLLDISTDISKASENLVFNSLVCLNIGINRSNISDKHWIYFPEKKYIFNRISIQSNFSPYTVPQGKSSIIVEVTHRDKTLGVEETKHRVLEGLIEADLLRKDDEIEVFDAIAVKYAYVIYDLNHRKNVSTIHRFLRESGVIPAGRFGEWEYHNMDKSILSGRSAAEEAIA